MLDTIDSLIGVLTAVVIAVRFAWKYKEKKYKEKIEGWYYVASYQLTKPFRKDSFNKTVTVTARVAGRIRSKRNPFTGEWETSRVSFKTNKPERI